MYFSGHLHSPYICVFGVPARCIGACGIKPSSSDAMNYNFFFSNLFLHLQHFWEKQGVCDSFWNKSQISWLQIICLDHKLFPSQKIQFCPGLCPWLLVVWFFLFFYFSLLRICRFWFGLHRVLQYFRIMPCMNNLNIKRQYFNFLLCGFFFAGFHF